VEEGKGKHSIQNTEAQPQALLRDTKRRFIKAMIFHSIYTIIWAILGVLIPEGNWLAVYNITLALLSYWIFNSFYQPFYNARFNRGWLSYALAGITWFAITLILINLVHLVIK
jgi:hypothetical protein